ncbi:hypothetical protein [Nocardia amamiensis]|uniref:hypothetical protein n=1 Tax=Nocardia amamiensis TaxID=404578 RepID=UPI0008305BA3|nr:hypothetical protein [Nocardia amamiensis]
MLDPGDVDALQVAREQLRIAMVADTTNRSIEFRVQLGLLAAQVALAERLPLSDTAARRGMKLEDDEFVWSDVLVARFLKNTSPTGLKLIRLLAAEGGAATPARVKEITGYKSLAAITSALRAAAMDTTPHRAPPPSLVEVRRTRDQKNPTVLEYRLAKGTLPWVMQALERLDDND